MLDLNWKKRDADLARIGNLSLELASCGAGYFLFSEQEDNEGQSQQHFKISQGGLTHFGGRNRFAIGYALSLSGRQDVCGVFDFGPRSILSIVLMLQYSAVCFFNYAKNSQRTPKTF
jgi:hypothetical protein